MKVLVVHNRYQSHHIGGEDLVVEREIRGLKSTLGDNNVFEYTVSNDDIQSSRLLFTLWGDKRHYQNIFKLVQDNEIDIVHVHNFFPLLTPTVFKAAKKAGALVIHTLHNFRWWCLSGILYRDNKGECESCVEKTFAWPAVVNGCYRGSRLQSAAGALAFSWYDLKDYQDSIDAYFVLSEFQSEKLKKWIPSKMHLKPNAIDVPTHAYEGEKKDFLFVGRLESSKGIDLLLSVWNDLPENMILNVVGGSNDNSRQQQYQKSNIRFWGQRSHPDVLAMMAQAKYFIHPSLTYETFGLTLVESLAQGTPVIALNKGPRAEFIQDGLNGFLCDEQTLRDTIIQASHFKGHDVLSHNAIQSAKAFYLPEVIKKQVGLYKALLC